MTIADHIVRALGEAGVRALFGVPGGGSNLDLIEAAGQVGLPFVLTATETAAAIAAMAQAEITARPGACLTTLGPGAASVVNGVACAFLDRAPLIVFTDSLAASARVFEHQRLDHRALFAPIAKMSTQLAPESAMATLDCALQAVVTGRPGPVHLDCPGDVLSATSVPSGDLRPPCPPGTEVVLGDGGRPGGRRLPRARKPLLLVGLGARRREDAAAIRALCDERRIPAMVTYKAKGVVPDAHPWFAGVFTHAAIEGPLIDTSDLLIGVGLDPVELLPRPWNRSQPIVYCGPWPVDDSHVPFASQMVMPVVEGVQQLLGLLPDSDWTPDQVRGFVDEQRDQIRLPGSALTPDRVVELSAARLAPQVGRVTVDAGAHMLPATILWPVDNPAGMLISNGLSTMGFALPAAIGASLLDRERPVVALTGDGGLLMCVGELLTAVRERLRIIVIVFNDASLSLIEIKQQARRLHPAGVALGAVDWCALAKSFGAAGFSAANEAELQRAMHGALAIPGPSVIDVTIDRSTFGAMLKAVRG